MVEAPVQRDLNGIAVIAYPAKTWVQPIAKAQEASTPVLTLNVQNDECDATAWYGQALCPGYVQPDQAQEKDRS